MSMTDPIADLFTRIRNGIQAEHPKVDIPNSRMKIRIVEILRDEGFIKDFKVAEDNKQGWLRIYLKYKEGEPAIHGIKRISKPGRRVYVNKDKVPRVLNGLGVAIVSTSSGVITDGLCREKGVGGEVLGYIW
ncbi:MAG: 30S ribosomal protein S8 [Nitrospina sp.]|nr:30S ribosomal protein S8 [Nitrospinota bacterium]TDJ60173.1 MAG: 30S ribosomal protein S8 [Nitrospina sp.]